MYGWLAGVVGCGGSEGRVPVELVGDADTETDTQAADSAGAENPECLGLPTVPSTVVGPVATSVGQSVTTRPSVAYSANGVYAVAWTPSSAEPGMMFVQRVSAGVALGAAVVVPPPLHFVVAAPAVATNDLGELVVTWVEAGSSSVFLQRFDGAGLPVGTAVQVSAPGHTAMGTSVALLPGGDALVAWGEQGVLAQRVDPAGAFVFPDAVRISDPAHAVLGEPALAADASGAFAVSYVDLGSNSVQLLRLDPAGAPIGALLDVTPASHLVTDAPSLASTPDGALVVAWTEVASASVYVQRYDATGGSLGGATQVSQSGLIAANPMPGQVQLLQSVSMACDGSFVVGWTDPLVAFTPFLRRFDAVGAPLSDEEPYGVGQFTRAPGIVAVDPGGGDHVMAWTDEASLQVQHQFLGL
ncbi:MAG: hypothetical protein ABMA64_32595 [Myxococcota bacterium]